jgi:hypothetical protein
MSHFHSSSPTIFCNNNPLHLISSLLLGSSADNSHKCAVHCSRGATRRRHATDVRVCAVAQPAVQAPTAPMAANGSEGVGACRCGTRTSAALLCQRPAVWRWTSGAERTLQTWRPARYDCPPCDSLSSPFYD